jgi:hypothetical protein
MNSDGYHAGCQSDDDAFKNGVSIWVFGADSGAEQPAQSKAFP